MVMAEARAMMVAAIAVAAIAVAMVATVASTMVPLWQQWLQ
jgi:hypothetical protein